MEPTKVVVCGCPDRDQDRMYGPFRRLANVFGKPKKGYKCTVCGKQHFGKDEKKK